MRAHVVASPGPPAALELVDIPRPSPAPGWVLIEVHAFGLNRSEMFTRQGHSPDVQFPRVLGIECVGVVVDAPGSEFAAGQRVAALMGGMGRQFDGGYAEFTCVPSACVFPIAVDLDWATLGATPEMFQTAWGSLRAGLDLHKDQTLLVRGGTSSVGILAAQLALAEGARVIATTRNPDKVSELRDIGVHHVIVDDGSIAASLRELTHGGVDAVLELIGTATLRDSLKACRPGGVVCMTGILGNAWRFDTFTPMEDIPHTVRLTVYSGGPGDMDGHAYNAFLERIRAGDIVPRIDRVFAFDQLVEAHDYMESNRARGKLVVRCRE